jgi:hypothetical protein
MGFSEEDLPAYFVSEITQQSLMKFDVNWMLYIYRALISWLLIYITLEPEFYEDC